MPKKQVLKKYIPNSKEKYNNAKQKFFTDELLNWKKDIIKANNIGNILNSSTIMFPQRIWWIKHLHTQINR